MHVPAVLGLASDWEEQDFGAAQRATSAWADSCDKLEGAVTGTAGGNDSPLAYLDWTNSILGSLLGFAIAHTCSRAQKTGLHSDCLLECC
jgi:hypothetical protein